MKAASWRCATSSSVDCGAWNPIGAGIAYNTAVHLPGPTRSRNFAVDGAYRRDQQGAERAVSRRRPSRSGVRHGAHRSISSPATLGLEPAEVRARNMIRAEEMPYPMGMPYRDGEPIVYDGGDYPGGAGKRRWRRSAASAFRCAPTRGARRRAAISASASAAMSRAPASGRSRARCAHRARRARSFVASGACPQGQGMETIFAQVVADAWSVDPDEWSSRWPTPRRSRSASARIASRTTVTLSAAIHGADARSCATKCLRSPPIMLECAASRSRTAQRACRHCRRAGRRGLARQDGAGSAAGLGQRPAAGRRCRARGDLLFRAADRRPGLMRCMPPWSRWISSSGA